MEIGVHGAVTAGSPRPDELARLVEDAGLDALAFGEDPAGLDLLAALGTALAATTRLRLEACTLELGRRHPITTAKEAASIDLLSDGRLDLVVGWGCEDHPVRTQDPHPADRDDVVRERMLAMRAIWREDEAEFHGEHVDFDPILSWPKPVQPGGVPLLLGGDAAGAEARALACADGWAPAHGDGIAERVAAFAEANPAMRVHVVGVPIDREEIERYAAAGATRIGLGLGAAGPGGAEAALERIVRTIDLAVR